MKLRVRKSEYQCSFALPRKDFCETIYQEQLKYRIERRQKENNHMVFSWESEESDCKCSGESISAAKSYSEDLNEDESQRTAISGLSADNTGEANKSCLSIPQHVDSSTQTPRLSRKSRKSPSSPTTRDASTSTDRCLSGERPPFLSYGWADKQVETGRKRTHNVQAPSQSVYPAALQRVKYLKAEKMKQKSKSLSRPASALAKALSQKNTSDSSTWQTEYQRCYSRESARPGSADRGRSKSAKNKSSKPSWRKKA